jgi:hypothetical protein
MIRLTLFLFIAGPAFLLWAAYHAFIKRDFASVKEDFIAGIAYFVFAGIVSYLLSIL